MNEIQILIYCFLSYLCLENIQAQLLTLIIAYYHPIVDFGFTFQLFHLILGVILLQLHTKFLFPYLNESHLVLPHSNEPIIRT